MSKIKKIARISKLENSNIIGRIGGNMPESLLDSFSNIDSYYFYLSIKNPECLSEYLSILVPKDFERRIENNIYPSCDIKVIRHSKAKESNNSDNRITSINPMNIIGYFNDEDNEFITIHNTPELLQNESYFYSELEKNGYYFLMQIDEDFYPESFLSGDYVFAYGTLYLYKHINTGEIIAGFWQYS